MLKDVCYRRILESGARGIVFLDHFQNGTDATGPNADVHYKVSALKLCHDNLRLAVAELQVVFKPQTHTVGQAAFGWHWSVCSLACASGVQLGPASLWCLACTSVCTCSARGRVYMVFSLGQSVLGVQLGPMSTWCSAWARVYLVFSVGLCLHGVRLTPVSVWYSAWASVYLVFSFGWSLLGVQLTLASTWCSACTSIASLWCSACACVFMVISLCQYLLGVGLALVLSLWCSTCAMSTWCSACNNIHSVFNLGWCLHGVQLAPVSAWCKACTGVYMVYRLR